METLEGTPAIVNAIELLASYGITTGKQYEALLHELEV